MYKYNNNIQCYNNDTDIETLKTLKLFCQKDC